MTIGIDGNEANVACKVGVSVYTSNLLHYFKSQSGENLQFIIYLRKPPLPDMPASSSFFKYEIVWGPLLWSQFFLPFHLWLYKLRGNSLNSFFSPAHYIPRWCPFKTVVTIHDLSYLYFPAEFLKKDLYQLKNWTKYSLQHATKIIAVSKTTKKDIMHEYHMPDEKVTVIYNGYNHRQTSSSSPLPKNNFPYFLYIGTLQPRKNLNVLIAAFSQFHKTHPNYKLILAGKKGWLYESIFKQAEQLNMQESIVFPGFVTDEEKDSLYTHAAAFILPSLYEGFGIPLLEAMAHGCPVISSFSSSLPEVGGEACLYFDPKNSADLVEKMTFLTTNVEMTKDLIRKGKKRIESFSWNETGKNTLHILQSLNDSAI